MDYLSSTEYNRVGTSVAFDHTAEAKSYTAEYVDGYTGEKRLLLILIRKILFIRMVRSIMIS